MRINNVYQGDNALLESSSLVLPSQNVLDVFSDQIRNSTSSVIDSIFGTSREAISNSVQSFRESSFFKKLSNVKQKIQNTFKIDAIRDFSTLEELVELSNTMSRYARVNETIHEMTNDGILKGYDDRYENPFANINVLEENPDYRRVNDGIGKLNDDEDMVYVEYSTDYEGLEEDDLSFEEQNAILDVHSKLESIIESGFDVTSVNLENI